MTSHNQEILSMMCEDKPIWEDIDDDGWYQVNQYGEIRTWKKTVRTKGQSRGYSVVRDITPQKINPTLVKGYYKTRLPVGSKIVTLVHRLVAIAFIPNPNNLPFVDHADRNPSNNHVNNLRWSSVVQNNINSRKRRDNGSGTKGVCFDSGKNVWIAYWQVSGKRAQKSFKTKSEAVAHRQKMVEDHYDQNFYTEGG